MVEAHLLQGPQGGPGGPSQFRVVALALQLVEDHDGDDDVVATEPAECHRVGQQHRGVEHVGASAVDRGTVHVTLRLRVPFGGVGWVGVGGSSEGRYA